MKLSHGAYGMLVQRYSTVLRKCNLINMFGSIAFASAVALGCVGPAQASGTDLNTTGNMIHHQITTHP